MENIYSWSHDLYPLVKNSFDTRYNSRINNISQIAGIVNISESSYTIDGVGGYGILPVYSDNTLSYATKDMAFSTTITPVERALAVSVTYKDAKTDTAGEAAKTGIRLADSAYMTILNEFYTLFGNATTTSVGADGVAWASDSHPVTNADDETDVFSNLITSELSLSAIAEAQALGGRYETPDGLPYAANYDLLLVSPELETVAREICGADAKLSPLTNPETGVGANPVYGMRYMVIGGGGVGFTEKQWALADSMLLPEILKLVYITPPTVLVSQTDNPLVTDYIGYVDFAFGFGDARAIIFSNPASDEVTETVGE